MKFLSQLFFCRVGLAFFSLAPTAAAGQTLSEAVQIALSQYPSILAAQSRVEVAKHQITEAQSEHWPQVSWQGTNSSYSDVTPSPFAPNDTWIQSPAVSINIWSGWRIQSQVDRASALRDSQRHEQQITKDEVAFLVIEAYLNWIRLGNLVEIAQSNLARHERLTSDVSKIAKVDKGRRIDVTQAFVRTENARLTLEQLLSEQVVASQRLRRMLSGSLPEYPSGYDQILGSLPNDKKRALALLDDGHPVIAQQLARAQAAEAGILNAKSGFSPTVDLTYQKQTTQGTGQGDYITQLNVRVPIFDGGSAYSKTRGAYAELEVAKQELREAKITLRENLLSAWSDYASAKQRVVIGERQVKGAEELVNGYDQQFRVGRRSLLDLLTVEDNLFSYRISAMNASFEVRSNKAKILAILNQLASSYKYAEVGTTTVSDDKKSGLAIGKKSLTPGSN